MLVQPLKTSRNCSLMAPRSTNFVLDWKFLPIHSLHDNHFAHSLRFVQGNFPIKFK